MLAAAIVCPGIRQVLPLSPEPIHNTDGTTKQDCEINAAKRILKKIRKAHPKLKIILTIYFFEQSNFLIIYFLPRSNH